MNKDKKDDSENGKGNSAIAFGYTFTGGMVFYFLLGFFLDKKFETGQFYTLCGIFLGLFYGFYEAWKLVQRQNYEDENKNNSNEDGDK